PRPRAETSTPVAPSGRRGIGSFCVLRMVGPLATARPGQLRCRHRGAGLAIHDSRISDAATRRRWMRGNAEVIAQLNQALKEELTAINQYFLHAEMCHNWGYHRLGAYIKKQSIDEMKHAEKLIERLLFLDATPQMAYMELNIGGSVKSQLEADLKLETNAVEMYNKAVQISREA